MGRHEIRLAVLSIGSIVYNAIVRSGAPLKERGTPPGDLRWLPNRVRYFCVANATSAVTSGIPSTMAVDAISRSAGSLGNSGGSRTATATIFRSHFPGDNLPRHDGGNVELRNYSAA